MIKSCTCICKGRQDKVRHSPKADSEKKHWAASDMYMYMYSIFMLMCNVFTHSWLRPFLPPLPPLCSTVWLTSQRCDRSIRSRPLSRSTLSLRCSRSTSSLTASRTGRKELCELHKKISLISRGFPLLHIYRHVHVHVHVHVHATCKLEFPLFIMWYRDICLALYCLIRPTTTELPS